MRARTPLRPLEFETHYKAALAFTLVSQCFPWSVDIQTARTIFGKCFFDAEKCVDRIQALCHYRDEVDEAKSDPAGNHVSLSKVPLRGWASHLAYAFRAVAAPESASRSARMSRRSGSQSVS